MTTIRQAFENAGYTNKGGTMSHSIEAKVALQESFSSSFRTEEPFSLNEARASVQFITPEWAADKLDAWHYELQRNLLRANVDRLAEEITRGRFIVGTPIFVCQTPDKKRYIVNGRHTLNAIVVCRIPVFLTVIVLQVANMATVGRVYGYFDIHRTRSYRDSWKARKGSDSTAIEAKVLTGIPFIITGFTGDGNTIAKVSREARLDTLEEYVSSGIVARLEQSFDGGDDALLRPVKRAGIICIALYTTLHQPSAAMEFWNLVVTESHPDKRHATRNLARYLREARGAGSVFQKQDMEMAATCWNRAWEGVLGHYYKPGTAPKFKILGTPWHRGNPNE